jgi:hypothetical protein
LDRGVMAQWYRTPTYIPGASRSARRAAERRRAQGLRVDDGLDERATYDGDRPRQIAAPGLLPETQLAPGTCRQVSILFFRYAPDMQSMRSLEGLPCESLLEFRIFH